jgi:ethanolamine ammonia-lyase small subunit
LLPISTTELLGRLRKSAALLAETGGHCDVVLVVGDGLSATGVQAGAAPLVRACVAELEGLTLGPLVIAQQTRVALGDPIGEALGARVCVMIIGERPGLSVHDSLGIYLTFAPRPGRTDAERNCISNIHGAGGLSPQDAARTLGWLLREALRRELSGVALKDDQTPALPFDGQGPA